MPIEERARAEPAGAAFCRLRHEAKVLWSASLWLT